MKLKDQRGFTIIKLLIVVASVCVVGGLAVVKGNHWYTEAGVLTDLQVDHPEMTRVWRSSRNVMRYSIFVVEDDSGTRTTFELNTNLLFNYSLTEVDD